MFPRVLAWSLLVVFSLVLLTAPYVLFTAWSSGAATRSSTSTTSTGSDSSPPEIGRYQVVRQNADEIVLLDTTSGELYKAKPSDIKPYEKLNEEDKSTDDSKDSDDE